MTSKLQFFHDDICRHNTDVVVLSREIESLSQFEQFFTYCISRKAGPTRLEHSANVRALYEWRVLAPTLLVYKEYISTRV